MSSIVIYRGQSISKNSEAFKLWTEKKWGELDAHLAQLRQAAIKRGEIRA